MRSNFELVLLGSSGITTSGIVIVVSGIVVVVSAAGAMVLRAKRSANKLFFIMVTIFLFGTFYLIDALWAPIQNTLSCFLSAGNCFFVSN